MFFCHFPTFEKKKKNHICININMYTYLHIRLYLLSQFLKFNCTVYSVLLFFLVSKTGQSTRQQVRCIFYGVYHAAIYLLPVARWCHTSLVCQGRCCRPPPPSRLHGWSSKLIMTLPRTLHHKGSCKRFTRMLKPRTMLLPFVHCNLDALRVEWRFAAEWFVWVSGSV